MKTLLAGASLSLSGQIAAAVGAPIYLAFCSNLLVAKNATGGSLNTVESRAQVRFPAGSLSGFYIGFGDNFSIPASFVVTLRVNGVDTQITKFFPTGGFGEARIVLPGAVLLADGDLVSVSITKLSGSAGSAFFLNSLGAYFDDGTLDTCTQILGAANIGSTAQTTLDDASTTYYGAFAGQINTDGAVAEADIEVEQLRDTTASKMYISVNVNTRVSDTILRSRVNGANGNQLVTIGAGLTGNFLDAINEDELETGDTFNYAIVNGAGAGDLTVNLVETVIASIDGSIALTGREDLQSSYEQETTFGIFPIHGAVGGGFDSSSFITFPFAVRLSNFILYITNNTCDADVDFYISKNDDAEIFPLFTIPASTSGIFTQNIGELELAANDNVYLYAESISGPGIMPISYFTCKVDQIFEKQPPPTIGNPGIFGSADLSRTIKITPSL